MSESKKLFAILRVTKLHQHTLYIVHKHNYREMDVPNAQEGIENIHWTHDGSDKTIPQLVRAKLKEYPDLRIQKNSVLAMEILLTASPEFYKENTAEKIDEWERASKQWLMKEFGDNVVQISTHYDEKSPHMHCIIVPIKMKAKRKRQNKAQKKVNELGDAYESMSLCANHIFTKESLTRMQTEYAISVKKFGLKRGVKGSKDTHVSMKVLRAKTAELKLATDQVIEQKIELKKAAVALNKKTENMNEKQANRENKLKAKVEVDNAKIIEFNEKAVNARQEFKDSIVEIINEKAQLTSSILQFHKEVRDERAEIKNEHAAIISAQNKHRKKVEADNAKVIHASEILSEQEQKSKTFIDAYFSPFLTNLDIAFSQVGPQRIKFLKSKLDEFDENLFKHRDNIPVDVSTHINKRLNTLRPKKSSLKY
ncbi:MobV family relaxase [Colwellia sp. 12G3]|uniref:MobV family relaxase n=1 Tax=Colwellia sp. 12G3 TaxID=2058299 RepID=UPI000C339D6E|nr:MobV family relaxase [Colwellia sp. 12G3]PKI16687.1 hypothetical protein CXF71_08825 [Colwellia sp. 12G3]